MVPIRTLTDLVREQQKAREGLVLPSAATKNLAGRETALTCLTEPWPAET